MERVRPQEVYSKLRYSRSERKTKAGISIHGPCTFKNGEKSLVCLKGITEQG